MANVENIGVGCAELRILVRPEVQMVRPEVQMVRPKAILVRLKVALVRANSFLSHSVSNISISILFRAATPATPLQIFPVFPAEVFFLQLVKGDYGPPKNEPKCSGL
jgi:hypothetical protein